MFSLLLLFFLYQTEMSSLQKGFILTKKLLNARHWKSSRAQQVNPT